VGRKLLCKFLTFFRQQRKKKKETFNYLYCSQSSSELPTPQAALKVPPLLLPSLPAPGFSQAQLQGCCVIWTTQALEEQQPQLVQAHAGEGQPKTALKPCISSAFSSPPVESPAPASMAGCRDPSEHHRLLHSPLQVQPLRAIRAR